MKRYKLLKDLPTFKAGTEGFYLDSDGNLMHKTDCTGRTVYSASELISFPNILTDWFEEIPEQPRTIYELKGGDECWAVFCYELGYTPVHIQFNKLAITLRETGSLYLTKEEAEKDIARNKARETLKQDTKGFKPEWKDWHQDKYSAFWRVDTGELDYSYENNAIENRIYFASKEDIEASIKVHEKEWKTYLGVEE